MKDRKEEYFNKLEAVLDVMGSGVGDLETLAWIAQDYLELLGEAIGVIQSKQP